jgi:hypothetical protein
VAGLSGLLIVWDAKRREHGVRKFLRRAGQCPRVGRRGDPRGDDGDGPDGGQPLGQRGARSAHGHASRPGRPVGRVTLAGRAERGGGGVTAGQLIGAAVSG